MTEIAARKLGLGTVQFGLPYGVSNTRGQVSRAEAAAILALAGSLFLGGPVLFPLVFTMVFGIIIGTYSSVYVALPIILLWGVKRNDEPAEPLKPATVR